MTLLFALMFSLVSPGRASTNCMSSLQGAQKLDRQNQSRLALYSYFEALACNPNVIEAQFNGELIPFPVTPRAAGIAPWIKGESLAGMFVYSVKGAGDTLQFVRFVPLLKSTKVARVVLAVQDNLHSLIADSLRAHSFIIVKTLHEVERVEAVRQTGLLALPYLLGPTKISKAPYLVPPATTSDLPVLDQTRFNVGVVFSGDPSHPHDKDRKFEPKDLAGLDRIPGVKLYFLQYGAARDLHSATDGLDVNASFVPFMKSYSDTAAIIRKLDLVISADTSASHLAAALGAPTLVPLPLKSDLRYAGRGADNYWYTAMTLFRQSRAGDWEGPMLKILETVRERASRKMTVTN